MGGLQKLPNSVQAILMEPQLLAQPLLSLSSSCQAPVEEVRGQDRRREFGRSYRRS